jgi:hypothetical protein
MKAWRRSAPRSAYARCSICSAADQSGGAALSTDRRLRRGHRGVDGRHPGRHGHRARLGGARRGGLGRGDAHRALPRLRRDARRVRRHEIDPREFGLARCAPAIWPAAMPPPISRRCSRYSKGRDAARIVRRWRCSAASPCSSPAARLHRRRASMARRRSTAAARGNGCERLRQFAAGRATHERLPGRDGALERGARGAGASGMSPPRAGAARARTRRGAPLRCRPRDSM